MGDTLKKLAEDSNYDVENFLGSDVFHGAGTEKLFRRLSEMNPVSGQATVLNGTTTIAVVFDEVRADADYQVMLTFAESPVAAAKLFSTAKAVTGFTINVDADPTADVDVDWLAISF
jgi:hypothetical protein